jgi:putative transposase
MTQQADNNVTEIMVQLLSESGLSYMADVIRLLLNEAMRIERSQVLEANPYQRTEKRKGYTNGFKPKTVNTRLGLKPRNTFRLLFQCWWSHSMRCCTSFP